MSKSKQYCYAYKLRCGTAKTYITGHVKSPNMLTAVKRIELQNRAREFPLELVSIVRKTLWDTYIKKLGVSV